MDVEGMLARLERFERSKARTDALAAYLRGHEVEGFSRGQRERMSLALTECSSWIVWRDYFKREADGWSVADIRLCASVFCRKYKICSCCASLRAARLAVKFEAVAKQLVEAMGGRLAHVVLTVRNGDDLRERLELVRGALSGLIKKRRNFIDLGRPQTDWSSISGAAWSLEVKRGKDSGLWHPHVHMLALLEKPLDARVFRSEWFDATNGDGVNVYMDWVRDDEAGSSAFREVFKYIVKFNELSFAENLYALRATAGMRLLGTFGCFHGFQLDDKQLVDDLRNDGSCFKDVLQVWNGFEYVTVQELLGDVDANGNEPRYRQFANAKGERIVSRSFEDGQVYMKSLDDVERRSEYLQSGTSVVEVPF